MHHTGKVDQDDIVRARNALLARALIDRSTFHTAAHEYGAALEDFRQALSHLGEAC
ncbi:hypothetical protein [Streptomyces collinus]|uniref:hypothetical protein n=1 Tax=Streptomyces collinus TaxID=42684 RepID=UPI0033FCAF51